METFKQGFKYTAKANKEHEKHNITVASAHSPEPGSPQLVSSSSCVGWVLPALGGVAYRAPLHSKCFNTYYNNYVGQPTSFATQTETSEACGFNLSGNASHDRDNHHT